MVLYDELPEELRQCYGAHIGFRKVDPPPEGRSINDWRFFAFRNFVREHTDCEAAFFTDLFDMVVQHNPFPWLKEKGGLAAGTEDPIKQGPWMSKKLGQAFGKTWGEIIPGRYPRCTAGLFGGMRPLLLPFLEVVCGILDAIRVHSPKLNANMPAFQMAIHAGMCGQPVHFGHPLHHPRWRFGKRDQDAFFHHEWRGLKSPLFA